MFAFLDPPKETQDHTDAERIARTIVGLRAHNARPVAGLLALIALALFSGALVFAATPTAWRKAA